MSDTPQPTLNSTWQPAPSAPVESTTPFAQSLQKENTTMKRQKLFIPALVGVIVMGLGTGLVAAKLTAPLGGPKVAVQTDDQAVGSDGVKSADTAIKVGQVIGAKDAAAFKDTVEGVLLAGGIGGEGSHHIVRVGGASQNVYLTSSVADLKLYEKARVKVSGETFKAQKAGWLMDVGRVEIKELNAPLPDGAVAPNPQEGNE